MSEDPGVLGKLPRTRPNVESPRRVAARERAQGDQGGTPRAAAQEKEPSMSGFEQLARAGVGLAGGAAAVGMRIAGRAVNEIGRTVGRN